jgi:hypothetical protein
VIGSRWVRSLAVVLVVAGLLLVGLFATRTFPFAPFHRISAVEPWEWVKPGFSGGPAITLTAGINHYVYYSWSPYCDYPERHQIPMIWGRDGFTQDGGGLAALFDGPCNDGRPLLFLNEPAKEEQANISPIEASHMFYTMTRSVDWPYQRWRGPIYAGNNLIEDQQWDAEFVRQFAASHNGGSTFIREIAGWGVHLYGNYEYGPDAGDSRVAWTEDIPHADISSVVDRSVRLVDQYMAARSAEGNSASLLVTEFGLLQASTWHSPPAFFYTTTVAFMGEYVRRFDLIPQVQAWFWFLSTGSATEFLNVNLMVDAQGALTPNGYEWRELASRRQPGGRQP